MGCLKTLVDGTEGSTTEGGDRNPGSLRKRRNGRRKRLHIPRAWSQKYPAGLPGQKSHGGGAFAAESYQSTRQIDTRRALRSISGHTSGWPPWGEPWGEPSFQGPRGHMESHNYDYVCEKVLETTGIVPVKDAPVSVTASRGKGPSLPGLRKGEER